MVNFISKLGVFSRGVQQNDFMNSYILCAMAPLHIIGASDFASEKFHLTETKADYPLWTWDRRDQ